jgi:hypothetical protein
VLQAPAGRPLSQANVKFVLLGVLRSRYPRRVLVPSSHISCLYGQRASQRRTFCQPADLPWMYSSSAFLALSRIHARNQNSSRRSKNTCWTDSCLDFLSAAGYGSTKVFKYRCIASIFFGPADSAYAFTWAVYNLVRRHRPLNFLRGPSTARPRGFGPKFP